MGSPVTDPGDWVTVGGDDTPADPGDWETVQDPGQDPGSIYARSLGQGISSGVKRVINPVELAKGAFATAKLLGTMAVPGGVHRAISGSDPRQEILEDIGGGLKQAFKDATFQEGPEAAGRAHGSLAAEALPAAIAPITKLASAARVPNLIGRSRLKNITNVTQANKNQVPGIRSLDDIDLPIAVTRQGVADKLELRLAGENKGLLRAKKQLDDAPDIKAQQIIDDMETHNPRVKETEIRPERIERRESSVLDPGGEPAIIEELIPEETLTRVGSGDTALVRAIETRQEALRVLAGEQGTLKASNVQKLKEQSGGAGERSNAFTQAVGDEPGVAAQAASIENRAEKAVLADLGVGAELEASNAAVHKSLTLLDPLRKGIDARLTRSTGQRLGALGGRAVLPLAAGGAAAFTPLGAIGAVVGVTLVALQQSPIWQTISAAGKAKLLRAWAKGDVQKFERLAGTEVFLAAERQREAAQIIKEQGEGVIS